jgi:hypothetical protein
VKPGGLDLWFWALAFGFAWTGEAPVATRFVVVIGQEFLIVDF